MPSQDQDRAAVRFPPPLVYVAAIVVGSLLHRFAWPMSLELSSRVRVGVTIVLVVLGVGVMAGAIRLFQRTGQDPKPWKTTPEIISSGIYRYTRNPMYVSMALLQFGIGTGLSNAWIVVLVPAVLLAVYLIAVRHEEAYLADKFGQAYLDYKRSVRRWL